VYVSPLPVRSDNKRLYPVLAIGRDIFRWGDDMGDVQSTLDERGTRYGDFTDHADIAQDLQDSMRSYQGWHKLDNTKKQALTLIADKIARILNGDPEYRDNWHDIQGYAKLAEDRCRP
jgi:hypothetical protein